MYGHMLTVRSEIYITHDLISVPTKNNRNTNMIMSHVSLCTKTSESEITRLTTATIHRPACHCL